MDVDVRPRKKRRFFVDDPEVVVDQQLPSAAAITSSRPTSATSSISHDVKSSQTDAVDLQPNSDEVKPPTFDADTFRAFIGEDVSQDVVDKVQAAADGDTERAINMYLDGSWKTSARMTTTTPLPSRGVDGWLNAPSKAQNDTSRGSFDTQEQPKEDVGLKPALLHSMPKERYVGSFGVAAWMTKSGTNLLAHGEAVRIERSRLAPKTKVGKGGKLVPLIGRNQKVDVVTRFTNARGNELGRLPEETASWVSALLDQKICRLEGTCVYAPDRVRVNDTVYLQLRAYLLKSAFESSAFVVPKDDNRATGFFLEKESSEEKDLRLRQVALVRLFDEVNLSPTTTNETAAKHRKQGLLRAAEMAEQYDKDKTSKGKSGTSTPNSEEEEEGEELEEDQLDALYQKAQSFDFNTPEAEPASTFTLDLRKYQRQALHWMLGKERDEKSSKQQSMHPLWEEYTWPTRDADDKPVPQVEGQDKFYVNLYSGEIGLDFPVQEQNCLGGILADEMGLGKTIEIYALIHSNRSPAELEGADKSVTSVNHLPRLPQSSTEIVPAPYTTLVVAPMSLLAQWESEAVKCSKPGTLKTMVYYGSEKTVNLQTLCSAANAASAPNVIITSYGIVLSEFGQVSAAGGDRGSHGGLFSVDFHRVILDEAHNIKNRQAKTSKACYELKAKHRWVLTGTPIVNRLEDLFSLVRFLKVEPWSNFSFWKTFITVPFESKDIARALNVVQTVLEPLVLRRTKDMKTPDGEALVPLPSKTISVEEVELSKTEREVYDLIFTRAKRAFNESVQAGTVLKSYTTIFAQILRLRQSCCHPVLTRNKDVVADEEDAAVAAAADANGFADDMDLQDLIKRFTTDTDQAEKENPATKDPITTFTTNALRQIQDESSGECPLCYEEPMINPAVTTCWHSACKECLEKYITHQIEKGEMPRCFSCRETINPRDVFEVVKYHNQSESFDSEGDMYAADESAPKPPKISLRRIHPYSPTASTSAKIGALLNHLAALPKGTKSVVFSQFTSFLDLISPQLSKHGFSHLRFDGTMSQKVRAQVIRNFNAENASDPKAPTVLLLSLRAGGVGLNLTAASRCYMMDPWWSFAVEAQAIDRVHRMGQTAKVEVVRFITKESIEGRMLRVQERKMAVAGSLGVGQSGAGESEEERKKKRIEELEMLLG
ncbi:DNA helicase rad5 [Elasticomyces elasticus]|uniref:DNA helicase rad5 n=1 Tax=Exophiala sideris TaxID=1016849 RepID=A0ABR0JJH8_9EURO|nr:DNA helicase rad5 [Elasticomyces elasticus]KAK5034427.1 DNA helicase rad5 [Exophiala sideris]KAK5042724.1 DNA helicase rad5 [Exophiala sideris]KAK5065807.1 DNA helicase rad5 [Exophiala sideris]KAK5185732.1 DNA helicase rad5 [Eurotiomycetes sp. CCFEE 6388]